MDSRRIRICRCEVKNWPAGLLSGIDTSNYCYRNTAARRGITILTSGRFYGIFHFSLVFNRISVKIEEVIEIAIKDVVQVTVEHIIPIMIIHVVIIVIIVVAVTV